MMSILSQFERFFLEYSTDCPYGLPHRAVYRQAYVEDLPSLYYDAFMFAGYRRMGNILYRMACPSCKACVPIRLKVDDVEFNRIQKRTKERNRGLRVETGEPQFSETKLLLYNKFLDSRYPKNRKQTKESFVDSFVRTFTDTIELSYYLDKTLVGVATIDRGIEMVNGIYFYFDPRFAERSPGIYNIIYITEYCKIEGIPYFVLGFYIEGLPSMAYKSNFYPHELLVDGNWERVDKAS